MFKEFPLTLFLGKRSILFSLIVFIIVNLSCNALQPKTSTYSSDVGHSNSVGEVIFEDPLSDNSLTITLKDQETNQPIENIDVWFRSNGTDVLIVVSDSNNEYASVAHEFSYNESFRQSHTHARLKSSVHSIAFATIVLLVKLVNLYQDYEKYSAFLQDFPALEKWNATSLQLCINPNQASLGKGILVGEAIDILIPTPEGLPIDKVIAEALELWLEEITTEGASDFLDAYSRSEVPSIARFTIYSFEDDFPKLLTWKMDIV